VSASTIEISKLFEIIGAKEVEINILRERVSTLYQQMEMHKKDAQEKEPKKAPENKRAKP
jgi:ribosomal protein S15P/S13E